MIYKGFIRAYSAISDLVLSEVGTMLQEYSRPIFFTCHSLGGALATICSLDLCLSLGIPSDMITVSTFGSLRGNKVWRKIYDRTVREHWRFATENNLITKTPKGFSYSHVGKQVLLTSSGNCFLDLGGIESALWNREMHNLSSH